MSKMQMGMLSRACRVRNFLVAHDVKTDRAELTGVRQEHDNTVGQLTVGATAPAVVTTQSSGHTTEVRRLGLAVGERRLEPTVLTIHSTVWPTRSMKREISGDDFGFVPSAFGVNDEFLRHE